MYFWGDWTYILIFPALLLSLWAQFRVQGVFARYARVAADARLTGAQVARDILDRHGLTDVAIERVGGTLADHYDPRTRVLRLSPDVHDSFSLAALGVAAHETGHALQHADGYLFLGMRSAMYPAAALGSNGGPLLFILGLFMRSGFMMDLGIIFFTLAVIFYLVTLPVEFNASSRAVAILASEGYVTHEEVRGTRKVLDAAAMTYVAAALMAVLQLLRLLMLRGSRDD